MTTEQSKLLAKRFFEEVLNRGDVSVIEELVADDFVEHEELPGVPPNREGIIAWATMMRQAFPDLMATMNNMVAEGDELWVHYTMRGTHQGEFLGIPATGRSIEVNGFDRVKIRNGKAIEHWGQSDTLGMLQQLGQIPA